MTNPPTPPAPVSDHASQARQLRDLLRTWPSLPATSDTPDLAGPFVYMEPFAVSQMSIDGGPMQKVVSAAIGRPVELSERERAALAFKPTGMLTDGIDRCTHTVDDATSARVRVLGRAQSIASHLAGVFGTAAAAELRESLDVAAVNVERLDDARATAAEHVQAATRLLRSIVPFVEATIARDAQHEAEVERMTQTLDERDQLIAQLIDRTTELEGQVVESETLAEELADSLRSVAGGRSKVANARRRAKRRITEV